jgi:hypothetical protein
VTALGDVRADRAHRLAAVRAHALFLRNVEFDRLAQKVLGKHRAAVAALRTLRRGLRARRRRSLRHRGLSQRSLQVQIELARIDPLGAPAEKALSE